MQILSYPSNISDWNFRNSLLQSRFRTQSPRGSTGRREIKELPCFILSMLIAFLLHIISHHRGVSKHKTNFQITLFIIVYICFDICIAHSVGFLTNTDYFTWIIRFTVNNWLATSKNYAFLNEKFFFQRKSEKIK